jgi:hypothetical protein
MSILKTMTIDGFYTQEEATNLENVTFNLQYKPTEFGDEIPEFNMVPENADEIFSNVLKIPVTVKQETSGIFRLPNRNNFIHFEGFDSIREWIFAVALQQSTFNVYEHQSGITSALEEYRFNYMNLFEWDLMVNYVLKPGQGIFFRPWLFHSFDSGLIQIFKLEEIWQQDSK